MTWSKTRLKLGYIFQLKKIEVKLANTLKISIM